MPGSPSAGTRPTRSWRSGTTASSTPRPCARCSTWSPPRGRRRPMADQAGRVAVVTGGGRGLGRGVALGLAGAGATVVAVARNTDQLRETERWPGADRVPSRASPATWRTRPLSRRSATRSVRASGRPRSWSTRPVSSGPSRSSRDSDVADWVRTIQIDAIAPYLTTRAFLVGACSTSAGVASSTSRRPHRCIRRDPSTAPTAPPRWRSTSSRGISPRRSRAAA